MNRLRMINPIIGDDNAFNTIRFHEIMTEHGFTTLNDQFLNGFISDLNNHYYNHEIVGETIADFERLLSVTWNRKKEIIIKYADFKDNIVFDYDNGYTIVKTVGKTGTSEQANANTKVHTGSVSGNESEIGTGNNSVESAKSKTETVNSSDTVNGTDATVKTTNGTTQNIDVPIANNDDTPSSKVITNDSENGTLTTVKTDTVQSTVTTGETDNDIVESETSITRNNSEQTTVNETDNGTVTNEYTDSANETTVYSDNEGDIKQVNELLNNYQSVLDLVINAFKDCLTVFESYTY